MIIGIGTDIVSVKRIKNALEKNPRFFSRVFSEGEQAYLKQAADIYASAAGHFAAKEALAKALGIGLWELGLQGAEVCHQAEGRPYLSFQAEKYFDIDVEVKHHLSISHEQEWAVAMVILEASDNVFTNK